MENNSLHGEIRLVSSEKIVISIDNLEDYNEADEKLKIGSYLTIFDNDDSKIIASIEDYSIELIENESGEYVHKYLISVLPLGTIIDNSFERGSDSIAIPPKEVVPTSKDDIQKIFGESIPQISQFCFSTLSRNKDVKVQVNGDSFFNKHFAIVGSTGSGKSHTMAKIIQQAKKEKDGIYSGLNNSHIVIFDIHSEYKSAFPDANCLDVSSLILPYWLMNGEELEELFIESGEQQSYNQISILRRLITRNKQLNNPNIDEISFDSAVKFSMEEVLYALTNLSKETRNAKEKTQIKIKDNLKVFKNDDEKFDFYFKQLYEFEEQKNQSISYGIYNDGSLEKFINRIKNKIYDKRLDFLFSKESTESNLKSVIKNILGYNEKHQSNVTVIDLSGVPFEVLSITVSLISRLLYDTGYYLKISNASDLSVPFLLVYEEAHKYVPKSNDAKYKSSRVAIERIAKEGRKYGITLAISSQRPSEISETIFSQCNNFVVMRLTNPIDQNYVKRLLPDNLGGITNLLPSLKAGQAILIGDAVVMPSIVQIDRCNPEPNSSDIMYLQEWKKEWKNIDFKEIVSLFENDK